MAWHVGYRATISANDCDHLGHMNVSKYFAAISDAMFSLQTELGLTRTDVVSGRRLSFAVVHAESDFHAEVAEGEVVYMESALAELGNKNARFRHRLKRAADDVVVFEAEFRAVCLNLETRRAVEIPAEVRDQAAAFME